MTVAGERLEENPARQVPAVVAFGANLGDRATTLQGALDRLAAIAGVHPLRVSPVVDAAAVGGPPQPDYLNAVLLLETTLSPLALLAVCQEIELAYGRERVVRWGPRTLDLDLIVYGTLVVTSTELVLPHPRAATRAFVLDPWLAVDPEAVLPGDDGPVAVASLLARAPDRDAVRRRPDLLLTVPR